MVFRFFQIDLSLIWYWSHLIPSRFQENILSEFGKSTPYFSPALNLLAKFSTLLNIFRMSRDTSQRRRIRSYVSTHNVLFYEFQVDFIFPNDLLESQVSRALYFQVSFHWNSPKTRGSFELKCSYNWMLLPILFFQPLLKNVFWMIWCLCRHETPIS